MTQFYELILRNTPVINRLQLLKALENRNLSSKLFPHGCSINNDRSVGILDKAFAEDVGLNLDNTQDYILWEKPVFFNAKHSTKHRAIVISLGAFLFISGLASSLLTSLMFTHIAFLFLGLAGLIVLPLLGFLLLQFGITGKLKKFVPHSLQNPIDWSRSTPFRGRTRPLIERVYSLRSVFTVADFEFFRERVELTLNREVYIWKTRKTFENEVFPEEMKSVIRSYISSLEAELERTIAQCSHEMESQLQKTTHDSNMQHIRGIETDWSLIKANIHPKWS